MSRGDRQKDIYLDDVDRQDFLKALAVESGQTIILQERGQPLPIRVWARR
jgi:hypothetical protein